MKCHRKKQPCSRETPCNKFIFIDQEVAKQTLIATNSVQTKTEAQVAGQRETSKECVHNNPNPVYTLWNK